MYVHLYSKLPPGPCTHQEPTPGAARLRTATVRSETPFLSAPSRSRPLRAPGKTPSRCTYRYRCTGASRVMRPGRRQGLSWAK